MVAVTHSVTATIAAIPPHAHLEGGAQLPHLGSSAPSPGAGAQTSLIY